MTNKTQPTALVIAEELNECGYHCGHTITMIMRDLGLICKKEPLLPTRKGRDLMRIAFREQMMEGP